MIASFMNNLSFNELYVFAGQSNMNDRWASSFLQTNYPAYYGVKSNIKRINYPETTFTSLGETSSFGIDTPFLIDMQAKRNKIIYAAKHSAASTAIESWANPSSAQLLYLYQTIDNAISQLTALNGKATKIAAFMWVQGEQNVVEGTSSASYQASLGNLINNLIRTKYNSPNCKFLFNYVKTFTPDVAPPENSAAIRAGQLAYHNTDSKSRLLDFTALPADSYNVHYTENSAVLIGQGFADALP